MEQRDRDRETSRADAPRTVTASELAQMGVCERRIVFAERFGERRLAAQETAIDRGNRAHRRFLADALTGSHGVESSDAAKAKCFIATAVYGQGSEVHALRCLRDRWLLMHPWGQRAVATYYRFSPAIADFVGAYPWRRFAMRLLLRPIVALARLAIRDVEVASRDERTARGCRDE